MPYPAHIVGGAVPAQSRLMSPRRLLAYAAALGAEETCFLDDARDGGPVALPMICVSNEWPVVLATRALLDGALTPAESLRGVHAAQDSLFHRPIRASETLHTGARILGVRATRAGALSVLRLDTVDDAGAPVVTSYSTTIHRGVDVTGAAPAHELAPPLPACAPPDDAALRERIAIARGLPHVYSECAEIWNPIHTERAVALAAGLPDIILHGTATWALAGLAVARRCANGDVTRLKRLHGRFTGIVAPGTDIIVRIAEPGADGVIAFDVRTPDGATVLSDGIAQVA
jgi:acyl dehydratase